MDHNPYEPPEVASVRVAPSDLTSSAGLWQDGAFLVLDIRNCQFPPSCVRSNVHVSNSVVERIHWTPASLLTKILVGFLLAKLIWGQSVVVNIGLSDVYQQRYRRLKRIGWWLAIGGGGGLFLFSVVYIAAMLFGLGVNTGEWLMSIPFVLASCSLGAIPILAIAYFPLLRVKECQGQCLWLKGAHPAFLASLPPWQAATRPRVRRLQ